MNKRPIWRTENGGVNVGMWVSATAKLAAALDQLKPFPGAREYPLPREPAIPVPSSGHAAERPFPDVEWNIR